MRRLVNSLAWIGAGGLAAGVCIIWFDGPTTVPTLLWAWMALCAAFISIGLLTR
jgi:hypothetical protein